MPAAKGSARTSLGPKCKELHQKTCKENTQENHEHQRKVDQKKLDNIKHNDGNVTMVSDEGKQVTSEEP